MRGRAALQIRRYIRYFAVLVGLIVLGTACGIYIALHQRLLNPFQHFYSVNGAFQSVAAVAPGLGEPVNVAGVRVGQITGTSLRDGQGIVHMQIDPNKVRRLYADAHADLVPNTPLKDMQVNIWPGTPQAGTLPDGATIPIAQTTIPVDADEVLSSLDTDTRTWLASLLTELGRGLSGRGGDLRQLLRMLGPTSQQLRVVGDLLADRHRELAQLVHNLGVLSKATSQKDAQLQTVVRAGDEAIHALASQDVALRQSIAQLPPTLQLTRTTLSDLGTFSNVLGPTATALLPSARTLPSTLRGTQTLLKGAALLPLNQIKPFVSAVLPLARALPPLASNLNVEVPQLTDSFKVLAYATNEFAYRPSSKNPGFLYWFPWFAHNSDSFISNSDANGPVWRTVLVSSCTALRSLSFGPLLEQILGTNFGC